MSALSTDHSGKEDFPWWLAVTIAIGVALAVFILVSDLYAQVFRAISKGIWITIFVTLIGFALASAVGLLLAVMGLSKSLILRQISRFYVEIIRGIPILVLLFYIAFVGAPGFVALWNFLTAPLVDSGMIGKMKIGRASCRERV